MINRNTPPLFAEFIAGISILQGSEGKIDPASVGVCLWANLIHMGTLYQFLHRKNIDVKQKRARQTCFMTNFPKTFSAGTQQQGSTSTSALY